MNILGFRVELTVELVHLPGRTSVGLCPYVNNIMLLPVLSAVIIELTLLGGVHGGASGRGVTQHVLGCFVRILIFVVIVLLLLLLLQ